MAMRSASHRRGTPETAVTPRSLLVRVPSLRGTHRHREVGRPHGDVVLHVKQQKHASFLRKVGRLRAASCLSAGQCSVSVAGR